MPSYDLDRAFLAFGMDIDAGCKAQFGIRPDRGFKIQFSNVGLLTVGQHVRSKLTHVSNARHVIILGHSDGGNNLRCQQQTVSPTALAGFLDTNFPNVRTVDVVACSLGRGNFAARLFNGKSSPSPVLT